MADLEELADLRVGDEVEYFIEGGWRVIGGKVVQRDHDKARVIAIYDPPKCGEYELGIVHDDTGNDGLLRLSEVTKVVLRSRSVDL